MSRLYHTRDVAFFDITCPTNYTNGDLRFSHNMLYNFELEGADSFKSPQTKIYQKGTD